MNMKCQIVKMKESSGNVQYFIQLVNNEKTSKVGYKSITVMSFETKYEISEKSCMKKAWFEASRYKNFLNQSMNDIQLVHFETSDIDFITKQLHI